MTRRPFRLLSSVALCLLAFAPSHVWANTFTVTDTNDAVTNPDSGSLRYAVNGANTNPGSTILFASNLTGQTITLLSPLLISSGVTITGPTGATVYLSGNGANRVMEVQGGTPAISNLTFEDGSAANGAGLLIDSGATVNLTTCIFSDNNLPDLDSYGAGLNNSGTVILNNCNFTNNTGYYQGYGGGLSNTGTATLTNCSFSENTIGAGGGGGIYNSQGSEMTLMNCMFTGNSAVGGVGAGISNIGTATIINCVFNGNTASNDENTGFGGGAIFNNVGNTTLTNCTLTGNSAPSGGGGAIFNYGGSSTLTNDILYQDSGGEIAGSVTANYSDIPGGYSGTGNINANPDFISSTNFALQSDSPCIGAGATQSEAPPGVVIPTTAINGATRPTPPSMGAYDVSPGSLTPTVTLTSNVNPSGQNQSVTFTATVSVTASGAPITTGEFEFYAITPQENSGLVAVNSSGQATYTVSNLAAGSDSIAVYYVPEANSIYQQVEKILTQTVVALSVGVPSSATSGSSVSVTVTANPTTYDGPVNVTSSDPKAILPTGPVMLTNGTATFNVTFGTGGYQTVTATDSSNPAITGTSSSLYVYVPPTANPQTDSTPFDNPVVGYLTGSDPQGTALTFSLGTQGVNGTAYLLNNTTGQFEYVPNNGSHGTDSFTFYVTDGDGLTSQPATVTIHVAAGPPTANNQSVTTNEGTAVNIPLTGTDPDVPALPLSYAIASQPTHGSLGTLNTGTGAVTYTPTTGYSGPDSFMFTVNNGTNTSAPATVSITVAAGTPTANGQTVAVPFNTQTNITLTGSDPQGETLTYAFTQPAHGTVVVSGSAGSPTVTYIPSNGYQGADSFTFTVKNSSGLTSSAATVTLNVAAGTPTANAQSVTTNEATAKAFTLSGTDPDSPALPLTYTIASQPAHGTLTGTAPNLTYTPMADYFGPDSFTFTASNGTHTSSAATVSLTINQVATHLSVTPAATATAGQPVTLTVMALDAGNAVVTGYTGTATLTDTDPRANPISPVTLTNGTGTTSATFFTAGSQTVNATAGSLTGSGNVTVTSNPSALPKIAVTGVLLASGAGGTVTLLDSGMGAANNVRLTLARIGGVSASSLGGSVSLGAGQSQTVTVTFPANTPTGAQTLLLSGADTAASSGSAGAFSASQHVTVP